MRWNAAWLWDLPLWRDWLFWLTLLGLAVAPGAAAGGNAIDVVFALAFQFVLFGVVPGAIRRSVRRRRDREKNAPPRTW